MRIAFLLMIFLGFGQPKITDAGISSKIQQCQIITAPEKTVDIQPTFENVPYGPDERNVFDLWLPDKHSNVPLIIFIHGGGFRNRDKSFASQEHVRRCMENGVAFASINYRFIKTVSSLDVILYEDITRAIQFLRYKADDYGIDKNLIACYGSSAGAGSTLFLAFHDDFADNGNTDPVLRESTRLKAAGALSTQCTYDFEQWPDLLHFSETSARELDVNDNIILYGIDKQSDVNLKEVVEIRKKIDFMSFMSPDDPPIYLKNTGDNSEPQTKSHYLHHVRHSIVLKEKADNIGIEAVLVLPDDEKQIDIIDFFFDKLNVK